MTIRRKYEKRISYVCANAVFNICGGKHSYLFINAYFPSMDHNLFREKSITINVRRTFAGIILSSKEVENLKKYENVNRNSFIDSFENENINPFSTVLENGINQTKDKIVLARVKWMH